MTWDSLVETWDEFENALRAFRWLLFELRGTRSEVILIIVVLTTLAISIVGPLWMERQRLRRHGTFRPLGLLLAGTVLLSVVWLAALQQGRARYLDALFHSQRLDPSQRAREVAEAITTILNCSAVSAVAILALANASLWVLFRGPSLRHWAPPIAGSLVGLGVWSVSLLVRTGGLFYPFGSSAGEAVDPSEKGRIMLASYQHAHCALESGRAVALTLTLLVPLAVALAQAAPARPTRREWRAMAVIFVVALLAFRVTRPHRADTTHAVPLLEENGIPCSGNPDRLPPLRGTPIHADLSVLEFEGPNAFVDRIPVYDVKDLNEILRHKRELRAQLFPDDVHGHVGLIVSAQTDTPTSSVLNWVNHLEGTHALSAMVVRHQVIRQSSVLGELRMPPSCAAVRVNPREENGAHSWGESIASSQE